MNRRIGALAILISTWAAAAHAAPILRLSVGASTVTIGDNAAGDSNPTVGAITFIGGLGVFDLNVTTGLSKPAIGSAAHPQLVVKPVNSSSAPGTAVIEFTDQGFSPPPAFALSVTGTTSAPAGSVTYSAFFDEANLAFGQGGVIATIGPLTGLMLSGAASGPGPAVSPYSLTQVVTIDHGGAGVTSFTAQLAGVVPEPLTLVLFGMGLVSVGIVARRRRRALPR